MAHRRLLALLSLLLTLAGCDPLSGPGSTPPPPTPTPLTALLSAVVPWGQTIQRYRYERTTIIYATSGQTTTVYETGQVVRPDRQVLQVRTRVDGRDEVDELLIIGADAWSRPLAVGRAWQPVAPSRLPVDPLTIALETVDVAQSIQPTGERIEGGQRRCYGFDYLTDLTRVPSWPTTLAPAAPASVSLWLDAFGAICRQTVRLDQAGRLVAEYSVTMSDFNGAFTIEPPAR